MTSNLNSIGRPFDFLPMSMRSLLLNNIRHVILVLDHRNTGVSNELAPQQFLGLYRLVGELTDLQFFIH